MPYFHETGFIIAGHTPTYIEHVRQSEIYPSESDFVPLESAEDFRQTMPQGVLSGQFPGWKGWWKKDDCGWIHARKALVSAHDEAERLGVCFITGSPQGHAVELVYSSDGKDVAGVKTADGVVHNADRVIVSAGATTDRLVDMKNQLRPTAWTLCHIQMSPDECKLYRNLPVLFNCAKGFFMEPDEDKRELKICDEHPGYVNWVTDSDGQKRSIPFAKHQIPLEAERRARDFLRDTMPHLAERDLVFARICWDADSPDRFFIIDYHPQYASLLIACGASGNGAMQVPSIGGFITDRLEGKLCPKLTHSCRWRPETAVDRDWKSTQDRFGAEDRLMDFQDVRDDQWTRIAPRS